jgi:ADP-ribose pyrophosphatase YjhB (NUDIX family)
MNKYLLVFDPKFNFWRVPGGRLKFSEKIEDCLVREIKEELSIEITIENFLGFGQDKVFLIPLQKEVSRVLLYFKCKIKNSDENKIKPDESEIIKIKWLTMNEIKDHENLEPGMKDFFKRFKI